VSSSRAGKLRLGSLRHVVIDEVDQCLAEGFVDGVDAVLEKRSQHCQTIFASATADRAAVRSYAFKWLTDPILIRVEAERRLPRNLEHHYIVVPVRKRIETLKKLMFLDPEPEAVICFVDSQDRVDIVSQVLRDMSFDSWVAIRGDSDKVERANVLQSFRRGKARLLLATEVAARGLDLPSTELVINLDLPTDADHYIHRAGRAGRAGVPGLVVSLTTRMNAFVISKLEKEMGISMKHSAVYNGTLMRPEELPQSARTKRAQGGSSSHEASKKKRTPRSTSNKRQGDDRRRETVRKDGGGRSDSHENSSGRGSKKGGSTGGGSKETSWKASRSNDVETTTDRRGQRPEGKQSVSKKRGKKDGGEKRQVSRSNKEDSTVYVDVGDDAGDEYYDDDDLVEFSKYREKPRKGKKEKPQRRSRDFGKRASDEGWVGNRS